MKFSFIIYLLITNLLVFGQQTTDPAKLAKTKEELQKLWNDMQDAGMKKDRKALEKFYADEFVFIHARGQEDNKTRRINDILAATDYRPAPMPAFDELYVYGDVAILRAKGTTRGTTIYAKKNGNWQVVQIQSTDLPAERKTVTLDPKIQQQYVGKYEQAPGVFTMITYERDSLRAKGMNRPQVAILPLSDTVFAVKDNIGVFTFYKDEKGAVTHYVLRVNGRETKGIKVE